jgi:MoaA/NifB/PqqE/SkfB family radical SAM enzyme
MKCKHCFVDSKTQSWLMDILSIEEMLHIIDEAIDMKIEKFDFTGGEPLIDPQRILEGSKVLSQNDVRVRIFTNGTLLTPKMVEQFQDAGVKEIIVSIDGLGETHDDFRGVRKGFEKAMNALKMLKTWSSDISVVARITLTSENYREIPELMEKYLLPLNLNKYNIRPFTPCGRGKSVQKYILTPNQHKEVMTYLVGLQKEEGRIINLLANCYAFVHGGYDIQCTCGVSQLYLAFNGLVKPCGFMDTVIGNCRKQSLRDIWESDYPVLHALRNRVPKGKCQSCKFYGNPCIGGCYASMISTGTDNDTTCPIVRGGSIK